MTFAIVAGVVVATLVILAFAAKLYRLVYDLVDPTIADVIPFLIEVSHEELEALLDPTAERYLRMNLGEREFRKAQQRRMKLMLRLVGQMDQNARALLALGRRERKRGWKAKEPQWKDLGEDLVNASLNFRGGAIAIRLTLHKRLIKSVVLPFGRAANLAPLSSFEGFELFGAYQHMVDAALSLAGAYGDGIREKMANAL